MSLLRRDLLGYTPLYAEKLDPSLTSSTGDDDVIDYFAYMASFLTEFISRFFLALSLFVFVLGDSKESFYFGSLEGALVQPYPNQWPPEG